MSNCSVTTGIPIWNHLLDGTFRSHSERKLNMDTSEYGRETLNELIFFIAKDHTDIYFVVRCKYCIVRFGIQCLSDICEIIVF